MTVMYPWMCKPSLYERFDKRQVCVEMICPCALVGNVDLLEKLKKKNREADLRVYEHRGFSSIFISAVEQFSQTYAPTFYAALDLLPLCYMIKQDPGVLPLLSLQDNRNSSQQVLLISGRKLTHAPFTVWREEKGCIILRLLAQRKEVERCFAGFSFSSEKMYFGEVTPTLWTLEPLVRSFFIFDSPFERSLPSCQFSLFFFQKLNKATLDQG